MAKIVLHAIPFCYGPASVALRLARGLSARGHAVRLLASGTVAELATLSAASFQYADDSVEECAAWAEIFCCICDPDMYLAWPSSYSRKIYLDFLYFMPFPDTSPPEAKADLYLIENYPGVFSALANRHWRPTNFSLIPPLIELPSSPLAPPDISKPGCEVLLTFGGTESFLTQVGVNTDYPMLMLSIVEQALTQALPGANLRIATSSAACEAISKACGSHLRCESFGHQAFLEIVENSDLVIAHPGLYTVFETVRRGRPLILLPPSNYTQVIQLHHYIELGLASQELEWNNLLREHSVLLDLPEKAGVASVLQAIRQFGMHIDSQVRLRAVLTEQIGNILENLPGTTERQATALASFAGDGLPYAIAAIENVLRDI